MNALRRIESVTSIALVADKNTATCFKLAGLKHVYSVESPEEAEKRIRTLLEKDDPAIILITERLFNQIHSSLENASERRYPVVIPIPDTKGRKMLKIDPIIELVRRKTGIEVKLQ